MCSLQAKSVTLLGPQPKRNNLFPHFIERKYTVLLRALLGFPGADLETKIQV